MQRSSSSNKGFSLVELIIVISIMAVLIGILAPQFISYIHKSKVASDWANLKAYYSEIETDYVDNNGTPNPDVPTVDHSPGSDDKYRRREIKFLDGRTVKLKAEDTLQLIMEAENDEEKQFFEMLGNYLLQEKQNKVIERNLF